MSESSKFTLTEEQSAVLNHPLGKHGRILAGPGTGKSATVVALIERLLQEDPNRRLRLLTFTRAATAELAEKVAKHPHAASTDPSTIHSFALSLLVENADATDLPKPIRLADDWEKNELIHPILARRLGTTATMIKRLFSELASNWESLTPSLDEKVDPQVRARFEGAWQENRRVFGYTLLQELPYALMHALSEHPNIDLGELALLVVDEYQDLNACDLRLIRQLSERGCSILGVGDDDQSIYSFRKAHPEGIRRFPTDYADSQNYPLSVTHRCGSDIVEWARYVIEGDPDRDNSKPRLHCAEGAPAGEAQLLAFAGQVAEARGVALLAHHLISTEKIDASQILILLRADNNGHFSEAIRRELKTHGIVATDPDEITRLLEEGSSRRLLALLRLLDNPNDSLAWTTLLHLENGIGSSFVDYVYLKAREGGTTFATTLLALFQSGFPGGPKLSASKASKLIEETKKWLHEHPLPDEAPEAGWGTWITGQLGVEISDQLRELIVGVNDAVGEVPKLSRFVGQLEPVAKDQARTATGGIRIMSMAASKGLTVEAAIVPGVEDEIIPISEANVPEERRLLYVAMTRARRFLFCTWAQFRTGPTARSGKASVQNRRTPTRFLKNGPKVSRDGGAFIKQRWSQG